MPLIYYIPFVCKIKTKYIHILLSFTHTKFIYKDSIFLIKNIVFERENEQHPHILLDWRTFFI